MSKVETIRISKRVFEKINKNEDNGTNGLKERMISIEHKKENEKNFVLISFEYSPSETDKDSSDDSNIYSEEETFEKKHINEVIFPISVLILINITASFIKKMLMKKI
jgi:hypothetical protein